MGILADSMVAYAQPLLDATDGLIEQMNRALALAQVCWNLALLPGEGRNAALREMQPSLKMEADEFEDFRRTVVVPMIRGTRRCFRGCMLWARQGLHQGDAGRHVLHHEAARVRREVSRDRAQRAMPVAPREEVQEVLRTLNAFS